MEEQQSVRKKTAVNLMWRFFERCGVQGVAFIVSIALARLLGPSEYGVIALVTVFTGFLQVFVDAGLGSALIQKKDADELDFSSVFYFNIIFCILLYGIAFLLAPFVAALYENKSLTPIIRVLSLTILVSGVQNVQQAYVSKKLIYRKFFFATLSGTFCSAVAGIIMAYRGFGVWALVGQNLLNLVVSTVVLWFVVRWRPKWMFSWTRLKGLFSYGWKLLVSSLINTVYMDLRSLIIGKKYSTDDLAYYNKGRQFPNLIVTNINTAIDSVLLPVMSQIQEQKEHLKAMTRRSIMTSSYLIWPCMFGVASVGEALIVLLLTEKWLPCVPFLYVFCLSFGLLPIQTANLNAIKALGRSDLYLKMEIIKKTIGIALILATMHIGVLAMAISMAIYSLIVSVINAFPNNKLLGYSYLEQIRDIMPSFLLSALMGGIVYLLPLHFLNLYLQVILKVVLGFLIYVAASYLFKIEIFSYLINFLKSFLGKKAE